MRIIAGKYKKSTLNTLEGLDTRPTRDMVREAFFSSVDIYGKNFLDLFAGSGAMGIEAISRGAEEVVFNDVNKEAVRIIKSNLSKFKEERMVYNLDWQDCLKRLDNVFDVIYLDPPYAFKEYENMLEMIQIENLINNDGMVVVEVRKDVDLKEDIDRLKRVKEKKYGINKLYYYRVEEK